MMKNFARVALAAVAMTAAAAANAMLLEYGFADGMGNREATGPLLYQSNGVDLTITGAASGSAAAVHINGDSGLGVAGNAVAEGNRLGVGESLILSFNPGPVTLLRAITFDTVSNNEPISFALFVDGILAGTFNDLSADGQAFQSVDLTGVNTLGSVFTIQGLVGDEGFRVAGIRAQMPEPGLLALFGLGLLGMAASRRRLS